MKAHQKFWHHCGFRAAEATRVSQAVRATQIIATAFLFSALLFGTALPAQAVYVKDHPVKVEQPDGTVLSLYVTGDEFFRYTHTKNGTIVAQDSQGRTTYAQLDAQGKIKPTALKVTKSNSISYSGLKASQVSPEKNLMNESMQENNAETQNAQFTPTGKRLIGTAKPLLSELPLTNVVIYIRFADEDEFVTPSVAAANNGLYNSDTLSVKKAIEAQSEGACSVSTVFSTNEGGQVISYQAENPRGYYMPYTLRNPLGYTSELSATLREHALLSDATNWANNLQTLPSGAKLDRDLDGCLDAVTFIASGDASGWNDILWPHKWANSLGAQINGKKLDEYNFQLEEFETDKSEAVGTYVHEMMHVLGFPDLYRYSMIGNPIGAWDVMATTQAVPQYASAFMRYIVAGWGKAPVKITEFDAAYTIEKPGARGVHPTSYYWSIGNNEVVVAEYRKKDSTQWDQSIPNSGLLIYRVKYPFDGIYSGLYNDGNENTSLHSADTYYLYRPNVKSIPTRMGSIPWYLSAGSMEMQNPGGAPESEWALSSSLGRSTYGNSLENENSLFSSKGRPGNTYVYDIGANTGDSLSFKVGKSYLVNFSSVGVDVAPTQRILEGGLAQQPESPTRAGYIFKGWYSNVDATEPFDFTQPINRRCTVYAGWVSQHAYISRIEKSGGTWNKPWSNKRYSPAYTKLTLGRSQSSVKIRPHYSPKAKVYVRYKNGSWARMSATKTIRVARGSSKILYLKCVSEAGNSHTYTLKVYRKR